MALPFTLAPPFVLTYSPLMKLTRNMKRTLAPSPKKSKTSNRRNPRWNVSALEARLMLAADCGAAVSQSAAVATPVAGENVGPAESDNAGQFTSSQIVFFDSSIDNIDQLVDGLSADHELVLIAPDQDGLHQITQVLSQRTNVESIHIVAHGHEGQIQLGNQLVDAETIQQRQTSVAAWSASLTDSADILIYGCETGAGTDGLNLVNRIARLTGADVAASIDKTGSASLDGDWDFERIVGTIESTLAFDASARENYSSVMPITIRAAGDNGDESMSLQVNGSTVATFDNIGTELRDFTYQTPFDTSTSDIRVFFDNDRYDSATGLDLNLRVDSITVEGVTIQTESPEVFSTGTWVEGQGILSGYRQSEMLHGKGYFQYPAVQAANGSEIQMFVSGAEGTESFNLLINGQAVASYNATTDLQRYTYRHTSELVADDVRIEFVSDRWDPANGIDENLTVDYITIDGETFQSESPLVYSTGTWTAADGIVAGYGRGEQLHSGGYFQYSGSDTKDGSRILVAARGDEGTERFNLLIDGEVARTFTVSDSGQYETYSYTHSSTVSAADIRVEFINDQWDPAAGVDSNLEVDYLSVDGKAYQTESPAVYSTGTWKEEDGVVAGYRESETLHTNGYFQFANSAYFNDTDAEGDGEWSDVEQLGLVPIHAIVLPDGKVFSFGTSALGMQGAQFIYSVYDPETGVETVLPNTTDTDIFCSNMSIDPLTGNVMIFGGDARGEGGQVNTAVDDVLVFDYKTMTIRDATQGEMSYDRWYGSSIALPNGEILVLGGTGGGKDVPEVFNATTGWRTLTGVDININFYYPKMWVISDGSVVTISQRGAINKITTAGVGSSQRIGTVTVPHNNSSPGVMYDVDKIAIVGTDAKIYTADLSAATPVFTAVAEVQTARRDAGMSMLPDGRVIITGGGVLYRDLGTAAYSAEIWDPATNEVEVVAQLQLARLYHSTHLLLPNGTIWAGGGGAPGPLTNLNVEFYSPDYLYNDDGSLATRPVISEAPSNVNNNDSFTISVENANAINRITAVRSGALTHAVNSDTRFLELQFNILDNNTIEVFTENANTMVPGTWMMFALDLNGTPSEASMLAVAMANIIDTPNLRV